jgi:hypothetical protein
MLKGMPNAHTKMDNHEQKNFNPQSSLELVRNFNYIGISNPNLLYIDYTIN